MTTSPSESITQLPDLRIDSSQGLFNLQDLKGQLSLLYFYPKGMTSGCTVQAQDFRDLQPEFQSLGVKIYGVSRDSLKSHEKFIAKENIPFVLISDPSELLCRQFEVIKTKNMYGKQVQGIERSSFLFDQNGRLLTSWRKVKAAGHAQSIIEFIKTQHIEP